MRFLYDFIAALIVGSSLRCAALAVDWRYARSSALASPEPGCRRNAAPDEGVACVSEPAPDRKTRPALLTANAPLSTGSPPSSAAEP